MEQYKRNGSNGRRYEEERKNKGGKDENHSLKALCLVMNTACTCKNSMSASCEPDIDICTRVILSEAGSRHTTMTSNSSGDFSGNFSGN